MPHSSYKDKKNPAIPVKNRENWQAWYQNPRTLINI
jgi:hypothetical protein